MQELSTLEIINANSEDYLYMFGEKEFDLCLTDPPYGIAKTKVTGFMKKNHCETDYAWDVRPSKSVFEQIKRISKHQIVFGYNYLADYLGPCKSPVFWDKKTGRNYFADGELIYTSKKTGTIRKFEHQWCGAIRASERGVKRLHPTQKPLILIEYLLSLFPDVKTVIDPFAGSGTTGVACVSQGISCILIEANKEYAEISKNRIINFDE
jgi:DNA modification methylase